MFARTTAKLVEFEVASQGPSDFDASAEASWLGAPSDFELFAAQLSTETRTKSVPMAMLFYGK